jgi:hypothetical protein
MASSEREETAQAAASDAAPDSRPRAGTGLGPAGFGKESTSGSATSEGSEEKLDDRLRFEIRCLRNVRYHEDRERFFARWQKMTMFIVVCAGAAAFAPIEQKFWIIGSVVTLSGLIDLVFDVSGKARLHSSLRRRIYEILAQAESRNSDLSKLHELLIGTYPDEPPCMYAANALAYNEAMSAFERPEKLQLKISGPQRFFRNVWAFAGTKFETFEELERRAAAH